MSDVKVIKVGESVYAGNLSIAEDIRARLRKDHTFLLNVMASPGAGKSTTLLRTIEMLRDQYRIGVMEADIDATVDAEKMADAGIRSIQIHTGGECAMKSYMTWTCFFLKTWAILCARRRRTWEPRLPSRSSLYRKETTNL